MELLPVTKKTVFGLLAPRAPESHKGTYGRVLALCGCEKYRGAAALCVLGALRAGAGLVTLAAPEPVCAAVAPRALEATFLPDAGPREVTVALAAPRTVLLAGCGLEDGPETAARVKQALAAAQGPVVLDAGGLSSLAGPGCEGLLAHTAARVPLVLTPHPGEMARIAGLTVPQVQQRRADVAGGFARATGAVVVLKGHRTLTAAPDGRVWVNETGNPGLARGGSGDVLAGIIAGLAAAGLAPEHAALCGVWLHGAAADRCAARLSQQGMLPEDLLADLCAIFLENKR